jgi:hypothetical protein
MSEQHHDDIAHRLRESGTVPAPERLRDEVMDQVRAEPRVRRARRSLLVPVLPYAAAAAALVVVVLAISQLDLGSGGVSSGGAGGSSAGGGAMLAPEDTGKDANPPVRGPNAVDDSVFSVTAGALQRLSRTQNVVVRRSPNTIVLVVPRSLYADYRKRLMEIQRRTPGGPVRVILRKAE